MGFEFIQTMGYTWGYVFVIVIAGLALFVGATKKKMIAKKKLAEAEANKEVSQQTNEPELEKATQPKVEETKSTETQESKKDE